MHCQSIVFNVSMELPGFESSYVHQQVDLVLLVDKPGRYTSRTIKQYRTGLDLEV